MDENHLTFTEYSWDSEEEDNVAMARQRTAAPLSSAGSSNININNNNLNNTNLNNMNLNDASRVDSNLNNNNNINHNNSCSVANRIRSLNNINLRNNNLNNNSPGPFVPEMTNGSGPSGNSNYNGILRGMISTHPRPHASDVPSNIYSPESFTNAFIGTSTAGTSSRRNLGQHGGQNSGSTFSFAVLPNNSLSNSFRPTRQIPNGPVATTANNANNANAPDSTPYLNTLRQHANFLMERDNIMRRRGTDRAVRALDLARFYVKYRLRRPAVVTDSRQSNNNVLRGIRNIMADHRRSRPTSASSNPTGNVPLSRSSSSPVPSIRNNDDLQPSTSESSRTNPQMHRGSRASALTLVKRTDVRSNASQTNNQSDNSSDDDMTGVQMPTSPPAQPLVPEVIAGGSGCPPNILMQEETVDVDPPLLDGAVPNNAIIELSDNDNVDGEPQEQVTVEATPDVELMNAEESSLPPANSEINQCLLNLLECPVCLEWMEPPMSQCRRGHLVCASCRMRLTSCPVCRLAFSSVRNRAMEGVAEIVTYPCRYGCSNMLQLRRRAAHENSCGRRRYKCPMPNCEVQPQPYAALNDHFQAHHELRSGRKHMFSVKINLEQHGNWIVSAFHELFHVCVDVEVFTWTVSVYVKYIGPVRNAKKYKYKVSVNGIFNSRRLSYSRAVHSDIEDYSMTLVRKDCFHICLDQAKNFLRVKNKHYNAEELITFNVTLSRIRPQAASVTDSAAS